MSDDAFQSALQKITSRTLGLADLINVAGAFSGAGQIRLAEQIYKIWIAFNPEHPQLYVAYFNCSGLQAKLGDAAGAEESLRQAMAIKPDFMPAYINLGGVLERTGALDAALEQWKTVVGMPTPINGTSLGYVIAALRQLGRVYVDNLKFNNAEDALRQCLVLAPEQHEVVEQFIAMRLGQCKWPMIEPWEGVDRNTLMKAVHPLSMSAYTDDPLLQLACAARYVEQAIQNKPENLIVDRREAVIDLRSRRLRVGYVSSDLRDHAVGYLMSELFELHDKSKVEVFAYYCGPAATEGLNGRIKAAVEHWVDIRGLDDDAAARRIADDGIDILVDVNGHTRDARTGVFARRPAPIQANWLGYPGTMGSPYHQYIIADSWIIPPGSEIYYSEKVLHLPCYQPNDRKRLVATHRPTRAEAGLPDGAMVFCCFNGAQKISRFTFLRWLEILKRVPDSVLWLLESTPETAEHLRDFAERNGVDRARLIFAPKLHNSHHLARYPLADLFLDTAPYGAHTTASDALWMGVPVLTLSGRSFASRVCGSLVRAAGLADLVFTRPQDYVERAVILGSDRAALQAYRAKLEAKRGTCELFDMEKLVAALEGLFRHMCAEHQRGSSPQPDLVNLDRYLEVGMTYDHDAEEMLAIEDYHGFYRTELARRDRARSMPRDRRLWAGADGNPPETAVFSAEPAAERRKRR